MQLLRFDLTAEGKEVRLTQTVIRWRSVTTLLQNEVSYRQFGEYQDSLSSRIFATSGRQITRDRMWIKVCYMEFHSILVGLQLITLTFQSQVGIGILVKQKAEK